MIRKISPLLPLTPDSDVRGASTVHSDLSSLGDSHGSWPAEEPWRAKSHCPAITLRSLVHLSLLMVYQRDLLCFLSKWSRVGISSGDTVSKRMMSSFGAAVSPWDKH